jgi:hypothetical protein
VDVPSGPTKEFAGAAALTKITRVAHQSILQHVGKQTSACGEFPAANG